MSATSYPSSRARSYLYFRIFIGWIGIAFPFVLLVGHRLLQGDILDSISDYNYSAPMRNIFVGGLVALGMLLISYRYERVDNVVSRIAGLCAMGVAFCPEALQGANFWQRVVGSFHFGFAAVFFIALAYMALFLFTIPAAPLAQSRMSLAYLFRWTTLALRLQPSAVQLPPSLTHRKRQRNQIYEACGGAIVVCLVLLLLLHVVHIPPQLSALHPVFWLETLAILAFGVAWIVKGELILIDEGTGPDPVQDLFTKVPQLIRSVTKR